MSYTARNNEGKFIVEIAVKYSQELDGKFISKGI